MQPDVFLLYELMFRSRLYEEAISTLWKEGLISGEMHTSIGEEAVVAGVISRLRAEDALALDHRGTSPVIMRGIEPVQLIRELLGKPDGLCNGQGGHMHLFSKEHLVASSGIVGSSGPAGVGFALAASQLRPGSVAVSFFGEGSVDEGMMMESFNLAVAWHLPLIFVCKDNQWAQFTRVELVKGGNLMERVKGFNIPVFEVDGMDALDVWENAGKAIEHARNGNGPAFLYAHCLHFDGHFLGDPLLEMSRNPVKNMLPRTPHILRSLFRRGGEPFLRRIANLLRILGWIRQAGEVDKFKDKDPVFRLRNQIGLETPGLIELETNVQAQVHRDLEVALAP